MVLVRPNVHQSLKLLIHLKIQSTRSYLAFCGQYWKKSTDLIPDEFAFKCQISNMTAVPLAYFPQENTFKNLFSL